MVLLTQRRPVNAIVLLVFVALLGMVGLSTMAGTLQLQTIAVADQNPALVVSNELDQPTLAAEIEMADARRANSSVHRCVDDPLDDLCELVAYPRFPLSEKQIRMCDERLHARLPHGEKEYKCPEDPTCVACRPNFDKVSAMIKAFRSKKRMEPRLAMLKERFTDISAAGVPKPRSMVVVAVNYGQMYLFMNWVCSCERIGLDPRNFTFVLTTDERAFNAATKAGFATEPLDWLHDAGLTIDHRYKGLANVGPHAFINTMAAAAAEALVLANHEVFLMDVDVVWLRNPFPFFDAVKYRRDIIGSFSPREDSYGYVNGGAVFFVPSKKTKIFLSSFVNLCKVKKGSDQILLNQLLRSFRFRQLALTIAPHAIFNTHWSSKSLKYLKPGDIPYLAHTVGLDKAARFLNIGMWFNTPDCASYDNELFEYAVKYELINTTMLELLKASKAGSTPILK